MALVVGTALYLALGVLLFGRLRAGHDHLRHTISELGEAGAPRARLVAWGLFMPVGLAMAATFARHRSDAPEAAALAACIAIGYVGAAIFPCDPGSPLRGSTRQALHNLAGGIQYVGGGLVLLALGRQSAAWLWAAAVVGLAAALLSWPRALGVRGGVQRVAEACLFGALSAALARPGAA